MDCPKKGQNRKFLEIKQLVPGCYFAIFSAAGFSAIELLSLYLIALLGSQLNQSALSDYLYFIPRKSLCLSLKSRLIV